MLTLLSLVAVGFFLGMRHATDADHVIAITTIVSRERTVKGAALIGVLWGVGHTLTIALVGAAIILFGVVIPQRLGLAMEFAVAVMLVLLGVWSLWKLNQSINQAARYDPTFHSHVHAHGDYAHSHIHGHGASDHGHRDQDTALARLDQWARRLGAYQAIRPVAVGVVHGLAGSAAVALMVLAAIREPVWALAYLGLFGLGTVAGMALMTAGLAAPFAYSADRFPHFNRRLRAASGLLSLAFGVFLMLHIGFVEGLFAR